MESTKAELYGRGPIGQAQSVDSTANPEQRELEPPWREKTCEHAGQLQSPFFRLPLEVILEKLGRDEPPTKSFSDQTYNIQRSSLSGSVQVD